jgi:hypothetical protein
LAPPRRDAAGADVDAVTTAVLTASQLLVAVAARSLAAVDTPSRCRSSG